MMNTLCGCMADVINNRRHIPGAIISWTTSNHRYINTNIKHSVIFPVINSVASRGRLRLIIKAD